MLKTMAVRATIAVVLAGLSMSAHAIADSPQRVDIPAGELRQALLQVSEQFGTDLVYSPERIQGIQTRGAHGQLTTEQAVTRLLEGTPLELRTDPSGAMLITPPAAAKDAPRGEVTAGEDEKPAQRQKVVELDEIVVTGTHIRGATPVAAPLIVKTQEDAREQGQGTIVELVQSIPQNFGGGVNPGVGTSIPSGKGSPVGDISTINLRGLGSDATLTLLDGHRLSYGGPQQGVDISSIPLLALDRIEVVADGSSALYGSDAVGGVANVILKRDYQGLANSIRVGSSTDGGYDQVQAGAIAGSRWDSGGFMVAGEYDHVTPILSDDRSYTAATPSVTLVPRAVSERFVARGHQDLTPTLHFNIDGLFNFRKNETDLPTSAGAAAAHDYSLGGQLAFYRSKNFAVAPSLDLDVGRWNIGVATLYGRDLTNYHVNLYSNHALLVQTDGCYCNTTASVELTGSGPVLALPAGDLKAAVGIGHSSDTFHVVTRLPATGANYSHSQPVDYAYGELDLPVVSANQNISAIRRLNLTGALRYEDYTSKYSVVTPKLSLIYAPVDEIGIGVSWGRSFKAPQLQQQYNPVSAIDYTAASRGGVGYPATAQAILLTGGDPTLDPERASSWTVTVRLDPNSVPGLRVEASYFNTSYRDRVIIPIANLAQSLSNPFYADRITLNPSAVDIAQIFATTPVFAASAAAPDPAKVVAIINDRATNAAGQFIHGVDLTASYSVLQAGKGSLSFQANATYIDFHQQLTALQPSLPITGYLFGPPHYRGRAGATFKRADITFSSFVNYTGPVIDTNSPTLATLHSLTSVDFSARYAPSPDSGLLKGLDLSLSVADAFNAQPAKRVISTPQDYSYDQTNYPPIGRFVSLSLIKKW